MKIVNSDSQEARKVNVKGDDNLSHIKRYTLKYSYLVIEHQDLFYSMETWTRSVEDVLHPIGLPRVAQQGLINQ